MIASVASTEAKNARLADLSRLGHFSGPGRPTPPTNRFRQTTCVPAGADVRSVDSPPAQAPARVSFNALPWAEVFVDGKRLGSTPLLGRQLRPGEHSVRFVNPALNVDRRMTIELKPDERRDLIVDLR